MRIRYFLPAFLGMLICQDAFAAQALRNRSRDAAGGPPIPASAAVAGPTASRHALTALKPTIWTTLQIPVCWENPTDGDASDRSSIRNKIAATWEAASQVQFVGWAKCANGARGIRVSLDDGWPRVVALGAALDGVESGMHLNLNHPNCAGPGRISCVSIVATHEFGHALGFAHEQNRADAPAWCRDKGQGTDGDIYMTPFDIESIMNYCNPNANNDGKLSAQDIAGLQFWYGPGVSSGVPWLPNCRGDIVLYQDIRFGGRAVPIHGSMQELGVENFNDAASALCVPDGYRLVLYEDNYFRGRKMSIDGPDMVLSLGDRQTQGGGNWNDKISSLKMVDLHSKKEVYDAQNECARTALIFSDWHFRGESILLSANIQNLNSNAFNDRITSLCVPAGRTLTLWEHADYKGERISIVGPMFVQTLNDRGWNDRVSSVQLK